MDIGNPVLKSIDAEEHFAYSHEIKLILRQSIYYYNNNDNEFTKWYQDAYVFWSY